MAALLLLGLLLAPAPRAATPSRPAAFLAAARHPWVGRMALLRGFPAVRRWRFRPATMGGQPVRVRANVRVNFSLY